MHGDLRSVDLVTTLSTPKRSTQLRRILMGVTGLALVSSCAHPVFHATPGTKFPAREPNCTFKILATTPGPGYEEVGILSIEGDRTAGAGSYTDPQEFADKVRPAVCGAGGDALTTEVSGDGYIARGIVFRKVGPTTPTPAATGCDPVCSPGFSCVEKQCIPQCNPACGAGETCENDRLCHAAEK